jgi:hypothetical protein
VGAACGRVGRGTRQQRRMWRGVHTGMWWAAGSGAVRWRGTRRRDAMGRGGRRFAYPRPGARGVNVGRDSHLSPSPPPPLDPSGRPPNRVTRLYRRAGRPARASGGRRGSEAAHRLPRARAQRQKFLRRAFTPAPGLALLEPERSGTRCRGRECAEPASSSVCSRARHRTSLREVPLPTRVRWSRMTARRSPTSTTRR